MEKVSCFKFQVVHMDSHIHWKSNTSAVRGKALSPLLKDPQEAPSPQEGTVDCFLSIAGPWRLGWHIASLCDSPVAPWNTGRTYKGSSTQARKSLDTIYHIVPYTHRIIKDIMRPCYRMSELVPPGRRYRQMKRH